MVHEQKDDKQRDEMMREETPEPETEEKQEGAEAEECVHIEDELKECQDRVLRLAAELDNYKKRIEREKAEHIKYALEEFAKELLPFLDNLERALGAARESRDLDALIEGLELTVSGYLKTLERFGIKCYDAEGKCFDPSLHEALSVEENPDVEENTVINELVKGYTLNERVLRPALVIVSKKPSGGSGQDEKSA